ncbi:HET-domain-containing protein [Lindgomyces ingoldianus]|uniref:HET-domain-containing protein n=1 Tax=Lindgomyces ingoldianus TaxID=673940 RepID=A0ACB6R464_9PLEO|nr:HET-domain-containing protein [Lindgomyces ingoldianus]KAF2473226.1 HET-domain-containing protein [Lindgomyces ingoldianus]
MRLLLRSDTGGVSLTQDFLGDDLIPPYAILSHTWIEGQEVTFRDLMDGTGQNKAGYEKIRFCGQQADRDGLQHFWVDTCCIDKSDHVELQDAINSMFRWYQNAAKCYVYLSDVSITKRKASSGCSEFAWEPAFRVSRWFNRGWTLQELLAPRSVEFFSQEGKYLGNKRSLEQQIYQITSIGVPALQGSPLCNFDVEERLSWMEGRRTTRKEDRAYSLLGIFGIYMLPNYGEGEENAFRRLREEIDRVSSGPQLKEDRICIQNLRLTDPRNDKRRIEETKGGLLKDSYRWILENSDFRRWSDGQQSRLLWIKGEPGKGKTMLLCGIIDELNKLMGKTALLSYFFCQAMDSRINSATAVLRGLLYLLVDQQPSLVLHIRKKHDHAGKALFEDMNAWVALCEIFTDILQDLNQKSTYLIIDALDECVIDLPRLLDFIIQKSIVYPHVKWIISSRNWPDIEGRLERAGNKVRLSLELNAESVSTAVRSYVRHQVTQLAQEKKYDNKTRDAVLAHLFLNAHDTFLWVALVCQHLRDVPRWKVFAKLKAFPPGLSPLYNRMLEHIRNSDDADLCKHILALIATVYRPITLKELTSLIKGLEDMADDIESLREIIGLCGSFLTIQGDTVYFVHQSAKEFLFANASNEIFPSGTEEVHNTVVSQSLKIMSRTLQRDMYGLYAFGYPAKQVKRPDLDPLAASRYSCIYWVDHLHDCNPSPSVNRTGHLLEEGAITNFIKKKFLYWLEALSLCKSVPQGVVSMTRLEAVVEGRIYGDTLLKVVRDARRFIMSHKWAIENSPLQAYVSALLFSPTCSLIRNLFKREKPDWIVIKPAIQEKWSPCLQTLEGHSGWVSSVAFSHDSTRLVSGSVAFSHDSTRLVSGSDDHNVNRGIHLSSNCRWITYNSENLLWLPSEYRPSCSTVSEKMIGTGTGHGRVWIYKVERNERNAS